MRWISNQELCGGGGNTKILCIIDFSSRTTIHSTK